ncbi:oligosaccharide biosynthesis protein Alg14 like-domain-containing protein [Xylaria sp. FL0043]|nr:oligosaccharide biosynthesis protein Alg14 like-domain-containing protein [Xylaria sp. FL0043]
MDNINRDRVVHNAVGIDLFYFIKSAAFLASMLGGLTLGVMLAFMSTAVYFMFRADADMVRGLSAHYVLIICGSGGHTAEMLQMVERSIRSEKSSHRRWAVGKDDEKSYEKILAFEHRLLDRFSRLGLDSGTFDIVRFGRARYVHQSWLTTPFTAILSLRDILIILTTPPRQRPIPALRFPGVIVTNGPGTGFLFLLVARALRLFHVVPTTRMRAIYVESWARVKTLSLTGRMIRSLKLADLFIVQHRPLLADDDVVFAENLMVLPQ